MPRTLFVLMFALSTGAFAAQPDRAVKSEAAKSGSRSAEANGSASSDYILQPQDVLKVQMLQEEEFNKLSDFRVTKECTISLPLIGTLDLKGKTVEQARELIRARYDRDYFVDPQVTLFVVEYAKRFVNVVGQVNKPGEVQFPQEQGLTLADAISRAGGPTRLANLKKVTLKRFQSDGTPEAPIIINAEELMKGDSTEKWPLQPGDVINVPERII